MILLQLISGDIKELLQELPLLKFIIVLIVLFVIPSFIYLITVIIKNKNIKELTSSIKDMMVEFKDYNKDLLEKLDYLYKGVYDESTIDQVFIVFDSSLIVNLHVLIKLTKRTIIYNNLHDKELTLKNIEGRVNGVFNDTILKLNSFKYKNRPISSFFENNWTNTVITAIYNYVYDDSLKVDDTTYNYDILYIKLNDIFKNIKYEFYNNVNKA